MPPKSQQKIKLKIVLINCLAGFALLSICNISLADELFDKKIAPFLNKYCLECHSPKKARGELDVSKFKHSTDIIIHYRDWQHIIEFIQNGEMPPEDSKQIPSLDERDAIFSVLDGILVEEAKKNAGDPGIILPRRLSNSEYDLSVSHLIGVDISPTSSFPPDPAGGEGFTNTGESLTMSPNLLKKYLAAAQFSANHLVLKPDGIDFAPFPVTSYADRKKLVEQAIIQFYREHTPDLQEYFYQAYLYHHAKSKDKNISPVHWANSHNISSKYFVRLWDTLNDSSIKFGYLKEIQSKWQELLPLEIEPNDRRFNELLRTIKLGKDEYYIKNNEIRSNAGNWVISHLDYRKKTCETRTEFNVGRIQSSSELYLDKMNLNNKEDQNGVDYYIDLVDPQGRERAGYVIIKKPYLSRDKNIKKAFERLRPEKGEVSLKDFLQEYDPEKLKELKFGVHPEGKEISPDSFVAKVPSRLHFHFSGDLVKKADSKYVCMELKLDTEDKHSESVRVRWTKNRKIEDTGSPGTLLVKLDSPAGQQFVADAKKFCSLFPSEFVYIDKNRGLAAGFHLVEGFYRDDIPLCTMVLNENQIRSLDDLWKELDFVTNRSEMLLRGFVWFERAERHKLNGPEFLFLRSEDPDLVKPKLLDKFEAVYLDSFNTGPEKNRSTYDLIHGFFEEIRAGLKLQKERVAKAEKLALEDLQTYASRAYRKQLTDQEKNKILSLYASFRSREQSIEESLRSCFAAILMSPHFNYRYTQAPKSTLDNLSGHALASRMSYLLWSSIPDKELLDAAENGRLGSDEQLKKHLRRMLNSAKMNAFAREFFGQWLRYRDFMEKDSINAKAFEKIFTAEVKQAMYEEPTRLITYLIQKDRPITNLLSSDETFLNRYLADHYGGQIQKSYNQLVDKDSIDKSRWVRVSGLRESNRGGLFGMGVILVSNSIGERTSPVKRGFWTVHHLLGQHFPPPPADVPDLPAKETEAKKTIRALLAEHSSNSRCAVCHVRFDTIGLTMEGFDPTGRLRTHDLGKRKIDPVAVLPNGQTANGLNDLIEYVSNERKDEFVKTICKKFLGYALGRTVQLSDRPLLEEMQKQLKNNEYRFSTLFETVILSKQFRTQRGVELTKAQ
jgi:hypothetical protein